MSFANRYFHTQRACVVFLLLLSGGLLASAATAQPLVVRHIQSLTPGDDRNQYYIDLLDLVLSKTEGPYQLVPSTLQMYQGRALMRLRKGQDLDVLWTMTSAERERLPGLRPIRIPLQKGLIGLRLMLVNAADTVRSCAIEDQATLQALKAGLRPDWPDTQILRANGYQVEAVDDFASLFLMLQKRRFDYFPRSAAEIWAEAEKHADLGLVVEPCLLIHYPAAVYFFVNAANTELAQRLEAGLAIAIEDGSFDRLFEAYYGAFLKKARLKQRRRFDLTNPLLPTPTPLADARLWYRL